MKSNILTVEKIIEYVDVPQVFLARDMFDTRYLCLLYDDEPTCKYTAVRISAEQYELFLRKQYDLRTLFVNPERPGEYFDVEYADNNYICSHYNGDQLPEDRLPESGFYYDDADTENITVQVPKKEKSLFLRVLRHRGWVAMM